MDTLHTITELAVEQFGGDADRVDPNVPVGQLGIDSLDFLEFLFTLEDHFHISLPPESVAGVRTLGELVPVVDARLAAHVPTSS